MTTIYGIRNCDTMKRAFAWLDDYGIRYQFHDYKMVGVSADLLKAWTAQVGWQTLLNTRGTTWRRLPETQRSSIDEAAALQLMQQQPSLIKRPVLAHGTQLLVGFDADEYRRLLG